MKLKDNKGVTGIDIAVAVVILILFVSLITGLFYNLSTSTKRIDRKVVATNIAVDTIEKMKLVEFNKLTETERKNIENSDIDILSSVSVPKGYTVEYAIDNYNDQNVVKIISAFVKYKDNSIEDEVKIETLKKTE